jgi:osmoprotectant transport system ATP-binding protein
MFEIQRLGKDYGGRRVVDDLSLVVARREVLVLVGESGSGKTTTLKMINRLIEPTSGTVRIAGEDTRALPAHLLRRRIGYVFQKIGLFPHMTVEENIAVPLTLAGAERRTKRARVEELLRLVELDPALAERRPHQLSGGQQQRVGVARALATAPELMLLDEPFGALDPLTRDRLQQSFVRLRHELGLTALFVTHDMSEALLIGDRIAVMKDGRLVQVGTPRELIESPKSEYVEKLLETPRRQALAYQALIGGDSA